jgi:dTDP-4-amino-4,6-dideoxygalactose transaminase
VQAGGTPVLVDVSERDYCIDPAAVEAAIWGRTRFLVPVHLFGQLADMAALTAIAEQHDVIVVEDACQAHGATRDGHRAGAAATAGCFSFYPGKNLGAMGDAGAITTDDADLAVKLGALREHGQTAKYHHELEGYTARLDTIQALVLRRKLTHLDAWNNARREAAARYVDALIGVGDLGLPPVAAGSEPVWHLFVVTTEDPDDLGAHLRERGIGSGRHYPDPVHLSPAYLRLGYAEGSFPVAERLAQTSLSLPLFPGISDGQIEHVVAAIRSYFDD